MTDDVVLDALGDPMRRAILERLRQGPRPVGELADALPISRPAVSKHLKVLRAAGLVTFEERGTRRLYAIDGRGVDDARKYLDGIWDAALIGFNRTPPDVGVTMLAVAPIWLVSDVVASCEELHNLFGFEIRPYFAPENEGAVYGIVERDWVRLHLSRAPDGKARPGRQFKREHCDAYLFVTDVDALHAHVFSRGAEVLQRPRAMPYPIKEMHVGLRDGFVLACGQPLTDT